MIEAQIKKSWRFAVLARDKFRCRYCGRRSGPDVQLVIDHIIPLCRGGGHEISNLAAACWDCNTGKGRRTIGEAARYAGSPGTPQEYIASQICVRWGEGEDVLDQAILDLLMGYALEFGASRVLDWIEMARAGAGGNGPGLLGRIKSLRHRALNVMAQEQRGKNHA